MFAGSRNYPPFEWETTDGEAKGFLIELEDTLAAQAGITARHQQMEWRLAPYALDHGEVDAVPMFISEERRKRFRFTDPFYYVTHAIYGRRNGPTAGDVADLAGHSVAVVGNSYAAEQLRGAAQTVQHLELEDIATALRAVDNGRADFAVLATHTTRRLIADMDLAIDQVSPPIWPRAYAFAVDKDEPELFRWLQHQLQLSHANGGYYRVYENWRKELEWHRPGIIEFIAKYSWLVAPILTVLLLVSLWSWLLHRRVESRTADLTQALDHRREAEERLAHAALHDTPTGLPNRAHFLEELTRLAAKHPAHELTVAAIRLNGIEEVILTFGNAVGMELLRAFGSRLYSYGFEAVGYLGSGEFSVASHRPLSPEHLIRVITVPVQLEQMEMDPRLSIGVVRDQANDSSEELLRKARTAVAAAAENRRTWQTYEPDIEPNPRDLLLLRDYWHRGTRDMEAYLQPQIDPVSGRVIGAEALVRWRHPEHGLLSPGVFIPVLEKSGIVYRVTEWMVDQAVQLARQYRQAGRPCPISVNIAASDILEHDVVGMVRATLARHQVPASDLRLEMTETGLITEPARVRGALEHLCKTGVECSVDDFGTGYSSLSYLSDFPVSAIKIDRRFVAGITGSSRLLSIVRTAVELAHELGLHVVAEGAEDGETVETLRSIGCDAVQGFVYATPMPAAEFDHYLLQHAAVG
nr:EAL domain-containing protein [Guyparkeria hydrothermalis]